MLMNNEENPQTVETQPTHLECLSPTFLGGISCRHCVLCPPPFDLDSFPLSLKRFLGRCKLFGTLATSRGEGKHNLLSCGSRGLQGEFAQRILDTSHTHTEHCLSRLLSLSLPLSPSLSLSLSLSLSWSRSLTQLGCSIAGRSPAMPTLSSPPFCPPAPAEPAAARKAAFATSSTPPAAAVVEAFSGHTDGCNADATICPLGPVIPGSPCG